MDFNQMVILGLFALLIALFVLDAFKNVRSAKTTADLFAALQQTITDLTNSPIFTTMAAGLANSIPQDSLDKLYQRADGLEATIGADTPVGQLLQRVEDYFKSIDSNPNNDPVKIAADAVLDIKKDTSG